MVRIVSAFSALLLVALMASSALAARLEYTAGHGDIRPVFQDGELRLLYAFNRTAVLDGAALGGTSSSLYFYEPDDVYVRVPNTTGFDFDALTPAQQAAREFLGVQPDGTPAHDFWTLPQSSVSGQPYFGLSTQSATSSLGWTGPFTWQLTGISGPDGGHFSLYNSGSFGALTTRFDTFDGIGSDDVFTMNLNTHAHYFWTFTKPGIYHVEITATGTRSASAGGGTYSATGTFVFAVTDTVAIPEPNSLVLLGLAGLAIAARVRIVSSRRPKQA